MIRKLSLVLFVGGALGALAAGCDNTPAGTDAGARDAGMRDATMADAFVSMDDGGPGDAGMTGDAGDEDAAVVDMDGGMLSDAAMADAAMPDAAMPPTDAGPPAAPAAAGDLVISEIMYDPRIAPDPEGEWIEVHNPGAAPLEMMGCVFTDGETPTSFTVDSSVVVPPGGYVTFAQTTAMAGVPGFTPDFSYPTGFHDVQHVGLGDHHLRRHGHRRGRVRRRRGLALRQRRDDHPRQRAPERHRQRRRRELVPRPLRDRRHR